MIILPQLLSNNAALTIFARSAEFIFQLSEVMAYLFDSSLAPAVAGIPLILHANNTSSQAQQYKLPFHTTLYADFG